MPIAFRCPHCSHRLSVAEGLAGKETRCIYCNDVIHVPLSAPKPTHDELLVQAGLVRDGGLSRADRKPILVKLLGLCVLAAVGYGGYLLVAWILTPVEPSSYSSYTASSNTFRVDLPEGFNITEEEKEQSTSDGKALPCRYHMLDCGLYQFSVKVLDAPFCSWNTGRQRRQAAAAAIRQEMERVGVKMDPEAIEDVERGNAKPLRGHGSAAIDGKPHDAIAEAYVLDDCCYVLMALGDTNKIHDSECVQRFFDSFEILQP